MARKLKVLISTNFQWYIYKYRIANKGHKQEAIGWKWSYDNVSYSFSAWKSKGNLKDSLLFKVIVRKKNKGPLYACHLNPEEKLNKDLIF